MQKTLHILSQIVSCLLHPLFIPTYGMILYMLLMHYQRPEFPTIHAWLNVIGTFILTAFIPFILIILLWKRKAIASLNITDKKERTTPYIYSTICFGFWTYFVYGTMHLPKIWLFIGIGATVALLTVTIINHWWKISAHLTGLGGLLGGICSISLYYSIVPTSLIITILILSLLVMYARLYLNEHTSMQVIAGYFLGLICTFTPNFIIYHA